ncbi:MAG: hypothetical protein FWF51_12035 [Chitinivibrionia bacterium]|nr:hypothetical protein [Chitinivibrionia bacterium]
MRSTFLLLKDIQNELKKSFENFPYRLPVKEKAYIAPNIWIGHAPPKRSMSASAEVKQEAGDPPFCIVRSLDGAMNREKTDKLLSHEINVGILCCVYSDESFTNIEAGYNDILNMVDRVLLVLFVKRFWENNHWEFQEEVKWTTGLQKELGIYEAGMQDHPYYGMAVAAKFSANVPERKV